MVKQDENTLDQKIQQRYFACEVYSWYEKKISNSKQGFENVKSKPNIQSLHIYWLNFAKEL